jgi:hypothetical protein
MELLFETMSDQAKLQFVRDLHDLGFPMSETEWRFFAEHR